jgi:pimeloyl-ACP methyl ester carboxylesterase
MSNATPNAGYFPDGLPYNRIGRDPRPLVVFQGLLFENKPTSAMLVKMYDFLSHDYTVYVVLRKPGMPAGYSLRDMSDDYAAMIRREFGGPIDVIGVSTGGSIVQHFAADHPDLLRRLVIHSSAYVLSAEARALQLRVAALAQQGRWGDAGVTLMTSVLPPHGIVPAIMRPLFWLVGRLMGLRPPQHPDDLVITVAAEDQHDFKSRLAEIQAPTLVIAGERDPFYTPELFRDTAAAIPNARLILYPGMGHPAAGRQFARDVLAFLRQQP